MILSCPNNRRTQLLFATGIERGIHDCQVLKYQPIVTSRLIFQYSMIINGIKWWNVTLDVTDGWYFRTWRSWLPRSMLVAKSNWVCLITLRWELSVRKGKSENKMRHLKHNIMVLISVRRVQIITLIGAQIRFWIRVSTLELLLSYW